MAEVEANPERTCQLERRIGIVEGAWKVMDEHVVEWTSTFSQKNRYPDKFPQ